jgi:two-component system phosphate regulon response regulator OmpR
MQIHILEEIRPELAAIDGSVRRRELEIRRAQPVEPIDRLYTFAGWTLDETTRDLMSPAGQRVDLTSSEFDLLMAFLRHPGQPLSRAALLGVLRGRQWTYFDRSIDTLVARLRKKLDDGSDRPPLIRSVRLRLLRRGREARRSRSFRRFSAARAQGGVRAASLTLRGPARGPQRP